MTNEEFSARSAQQNTQWQHRSSQRGWNLWVWELHTPGDLGSSEAAKRPLTDPVKSPRRDGPDCRRWTGETHKDNRGTTAALVCPLET